MVKLTLIYAMVTEYNETTGDWSGKEFSLYSEPLTKTSTTLSRALTGFMDNYYWGAGIDYKELLNIMKENADGNTSSISYLGDDMGNYDTSGNYLIDLSFKVEKIEPADVAALLK